MIEPYVGNLKSQTKHNTSFRRVLFSAQHMQLVVMCLQPGEDIGAEVHDVDQLFYIVDGEGRAVLDGREQKVDKGMVVCVPAGMQHNVISENDEALQLFTIYAPPEHAAGTVHETKADAAATTRELVGTGTGG